MEGSPQNHSSGALYTKKRGKLSITSLLQCTNIWRPRLFPIMSMQIPEMWVVNQIERFISVYSDRNVRDHLWRWSTCFGFVLLFVTFDKPGSRDGAVTRALASYQCRPGSIPVPGVICGLSLLLVLYSAPRGFSPATPLLPFPQNRTFQNSNSILECTSFCELLVFRG